MLNSVHPTLFAAGPVMGTPMAPRGSSESGQVCIPNISPRERRKRLVFAVVEFGVTFTILAGLLALGASRWWRLPLFLLFWAGSSGFFQWRDKTCVGLSAINARQLGDVVEKIEDPAELAQVKRQARRVQLKGLLVAIPLTLAVLALPDGA